MKSISRTSIALVLMLSLAGCNKKTAQEHIESAQLSLSQNSTSVAILSLKNALIEEPSNLTARLLLGEVYLNVGQFENATKELERVVKGNFQPDTSIPLYIKSLYESESEHELVNFTFDEQLLNDEGKALALYYKAMAYYRQGKTEQSDAVFAELAKQQLDNRYTPLGAAAQFSHQNEFAKAMEVADAILEQYPAFTDALLLKGHLASNIGYLEQSRIALKRYVEMAPYDLKNRLFYTAVLVSLDNSTEANKQADMLLKIAPEQPYLNQLKGILAMRAGDYENAKIYSEKAISNGLSTTHSRMVAGVSSYKLGNNEQTYNHLSSIIDTLPEGHQIKKLFGMVQINLGYSQAAMDTLSGLKASNNADSKLLIESSAKLYQQGNLSLASDVLGMIEESEVTQSDELTKLGMVKLAMKDKSAIVDFEKALAEDPEYTEAIQPLAHAYLLDGRIDDALALAEKLIESDPDSVDGYNLAGHILLRAKRNDEAESYFVRSLEINKNNSNALIFFGQKAIKEENFEQALKDYRHIVTLRPVYLPALNTYYKLEKLYGDEQNALEALRNVYQDVPDNLGSTLLYAKVLEVENMLDEAMTVLKKIKVERTLPNAYWVLFIDTLIKQGESQKIEEKAQSWVKLSPKSEMAWRTLGTYYEREGLSERALLEIRRGLISVDASPGSDAINNLHVLEAQYLLNLGKLEEAKKTIANLHKVYTNKSVMSLLEGQVDMLSGNCQLATPKFMNNYQQNPSSSALKLVVKCLLRERQPDSALTIINQHLEEFGNDLAARMYLANIVMSRDPDLAEVQYRKVVEAEPNNVVALNNLSWLLSQKREYSEAEKFAKRALVLSPKSHSILDTYGTILQAQGKTREAVEHLRKAYTLSGKDRTLARHYVDALIELKDFQMAERIKSEARL